MKDGTTDIQERGAIDLSHQPENDIRKMCNAAVAAANDIPTRTIVPKPAKEMFEAMVAGTD